MAVANGSPPSEIVHSRYSSTARGIRTRSARAWARGRARGPLRRGPCRPHRDSGRSSPHTGQPPGEPYPACCSAGCMRRGRPPARHRAGRRCGGYSASACSGPCDPVPTLRPVGPGALPHVPDRRRLHARLRPGPTRIEGDDGQAEAARRNQTRNPRRFTAWGHRPLRVSPGATVNPSRPSLPRHQKRGESSGTIRLVELPIEPHIYSVGQRNPPRQGGRSIRRGSSAAAPKPGSFAAFPTVPGK